MPTKLYSYSPATFSLGGVVWTRRKIPLSKQKLSPPVLISLSMTSVWLNHFKKSFCSFLCVLVYWWRCIQRNAKSSCDFLHLQNCAEAPGRKLHPQCLVSPVIMFLKFSMFKDQNMNMSQIDRFAAVVLGFHLLRTSIFYYLLTHFNAALCKNDYRCLQKGTLAIALSNNNK